MALAIENMRSYEEIAELKARLEKENVYLQEEIRTEHNFEEIVGNSPRAFGGHSERSNRSRPPTPRF